MLESDCKEKNTPQTCGVFKLVKACPRPCYTIYTSVILKSPVPSRAFFNER